MQTNFLWCEHSGLNFYMLSQKGTIEYIRISFIEKLLFRLIDDKLSDFVKLYKKIYIIDILYSKYLKLCDLILFQNSGK